MQTAAHKSDCATHNAPAMPAGECDCGAMTAQHTPTPWKRSGGGGIVAPLLTETLSSGRTVSRRVATALGTSIGEQDANANFILRACNAHDDMLDALCDALPHVEGWLGEPGFKPGTVRATVNKIKAAIAKAEGRS